MEIFSAHTIYLCKPFKGACGSKGTSHVLHQITNSILTFANTITECMPCTCKKVRACIYTACCSMPFIYSL